MKKILITICLLISGSAIFAQFSLHGVVAHRCGIYNDPALPENSVAALKKAMELKVYAAEIDVHLTADNIPIVFHDHEYQGVKVEESTYEELKFIKLSNGEQIPTLDVFIKEMLKDERIKLWIDLKRSKISKARDVLLARYTADVIRQNHAQRRMEIITPSFDAVVMMKLQEPTVKVYYIGTDKTPETLALLGIDGVNIAYGRYNRGEYSVADGLKYGLMMGSYVVDNPDEMKKQLNTGIHFITTNKPALLNEVLKEYNWIKE